MKAHSHVFYCGLPVWLTFVPGHQRGQVAHFAQKRHPKVVSGVVSRHLSRGEVLRPVHHLQTPESRQNRVPSARSVAAVLSRYYGNKDRGGGAADVK